MNENRVLRFGSFELDVVEQELRKSGALVAIQAQPLKLLTLLAERAGEIVSRQEIQRHVWGEETFVDFEQGINASIRQIRQALRDDAASPRFLETVPRRGYRFVAPVERVADAADVEPAPAPRRRWWALAAGVALAAGLSAGFWVEGRNVSPARDVSGIEPLDRPLLVVLPFKDYSPQNAEEYLADGMTEELITEIARRYGGRLGVIARTSAMKYKGSTRGVREIASDLGASYALEGSVRRSGERVRFTAQLIRATDQVHLWAGNYDREVADVLEIQSDVSEKIGQALATALRLVGSSDRPETAATRSDAYEAYLRGIYELRRARSEGGSREALELARGHLERAAELDPGFAPAYVKLARTYRQLLDPDEGFERSDEAIQKALALDESLAEAHHLVAMRRLYRDWDLEGARESFERAIEANPGYAQAHHQFAAYFSVQGRHDEAVASVERALRLDPLSPDVGSDVGWYFYFGRRYAEAIEHSRRTLAVEPGFFWAKRCILLAATASGDFATAVAAARGDMSDLEASPEELALLDADDPEEALRRYWRWRLERARSSAAARGRDVPAFALAEIHMALGETGPALAALEEAAAERVGWTLPFLRVHPLYDPLRSEPRFVSLVERISAGV